MRQTLALKELLKGQIMNHIRKELQNKIQNKL